MTSSSPSWPQSSQSWVHFQAMWNNTLALPVSGQPRLWMTRFIGSGSTGRVWNCHFDGNDAPFAVKIVEQLRPEDKDSRRRLRNEFSMYLIIEAAYLSGDLRNSIAPRCYGAFRGSYVDALVLDICCGILETWDGLTTSEL